MIQMLKQKFNRRNPSGSKSEAIRSFIEKVERKEVEPFGAGRFKTAYIDESNPEQVLLREALFDGKPATYKKADQFYSNQKFARMLKDYGIGIADLIYHQIKPLSANKSIEYTVVERMHGKSIESFGKNAGYEWVENLKTRALYGQKFMPKFLRDFTFLCNTDIIWDMNGENFLFDKTKGYSIIDIDFDDASKKFKNIESMQKYIRKNTLFDRDEYARLQESDPWIKQPDNYRVTAIKDFSRLIVKPYVFDLSLDQQVEMLAYRGVVFEQFKQMTQTYSREYGFETPERIDSFFEDMSPAEMHSIMPISILQSLNDLFKEGKSVSPEIAKSINDFMHPYSDSIAPIIPEDFNFSKAINPEEFMQAMATLENPNYDFSFLDGKSNSNESESMEA